MRRRPSARLLIEDPSRRVLLFHFVHSQGALAGQHYWATPGGGLEEGETFEQAAIRELHEECGIRVDSIGEPLAQRQFELQLPDGEWVIADEQYYRVRVADRGLARDGWTALETEVIAEQRWWAREELLQATETVYPEDIVDLLGSGATWRST